MTCRPPQSPERVAKRAGAPRGVPKSAQHKAKIAAGVRRWYEATQAWERRRGWRRFLSDEEATDYRNVRNCCRYTEAEALRAIGREDLLDLLKEA